MKGNIGESIVKVIQALLSDEKKLMKENLQKLFVNFIKSVSNVTIPSSCVNVLWTFAFLDDPKIDAVKLQQIVMSDLAATISELLKSLKSDEEEKALIPLTQASIEKIFSTILALVNQEDNFVEKIITNLKFIVKE